MSSSASSSITWANASSSPAPLHSRRILPSFLAAGLIFAALILRAEESKTRAPNYELPRPSDLNKDQQEQILKAFIATERPLQVFTKHFPAATFSILHSDPQVPKVVIATTLEFGHYSISLVYSGEFDTRFAKLLSTHCDLFGAYDNLRKPDPKERRKPLRLLPADMETFCREPNEYLDRLFHGASP